MEASRALIESLIAREQRILDGRLPPPHGASLYTVYLNIRALRARLDRMEQAEKAQHAERRARLPIPITLKAHQEATRLEQLNVAYKARQDEAVQNVRVEYPSLTPEEAVEHLRLYGRHVRWGKERLIY
jgi:hypothetical protein